VLYEILKPIARGLLRLLCGLEGRGQQHVPRDGALLLVANHSSFLDPPLVGAVAPRQLSFLAKEELFRVPLLGRLIHALNARPVRREGGDAKALRTALRLLEEGRALLVFPEGTRGDEGNLRTPKAGAGMLAVLSGATVVPAYVRGSGTVWPRGRSLPRPGKVVVTFGEPMMFERSPGVDRKEQYEAASRAMMSAIARLRDRDEVHASRPRELEAVGGTGHAAQRTSKYIDGRNEQHG
jgi:1-acyl-sn-glycerol-3-phosphate acyltransferase